MTTVPTPQARFGQRVRDLRRERGWTQERLAEESRLHRTYIAGMERGLRNPSLTIVVRLALAFTEPVAALFGWEGELGSDEERELPGSSLRPSRRRSAGDQH